MVEKNITAEKILGERKIRISPSPKRNKNDIEEFYLKQELWELNKTYKIAQLKNKLDFAALEELKDKPEISETARRLSRDRRQSMYDRMNHLSREKSLKLKNQRKVVYKERLKSDMMECTFRPNSNKSPFGKKRSIPEVLARQKADRLIKWADESNKRKIQLAIDQELEQRKIESEMRSSKKMSEKKIQNIIQRLHTSYRDTEKEKKRLYRESIEGLFQPNLNKKSLMIANKKIKNGADRRNKPVTSRKKKIRKKKQVRVRIALV